MDSLMEATLPCAPIGDEVDTREALVRSGRVSALSNEAPSLFDEEDSVPRVAEPLDAGTPEQDTVVPVTRFKVAEPLDAGISEEENSAILVSVAPKVTCRTLVDEAKPLVVEDWLSDKDIIAWLTHKLHRNGIREPRAWTTGVTYIVSRLNTMMKYEGSQGISHTIAGLAWRRHHIFTVNSDDRKGLHWFVCAMGCKVLVWVFKVWIWEPFLGTSLVWPMLKRLQQKGVSTHARALGLKRKGWLVMWL